VRISIQLFATLNRFRPSDREADGTTAVDLPAGSTVHDLSVALRIPPELPRVVLVNGRDATPGWRLEPGDVVALFPPLVGGA